MRRIDIARRARKNLRRAKVRTVLTALAIAVGATTIALAIAAAKGGNAYVDNLANKIGDKNSITIMRKYDMSMAQQDYKPQKVGEKTEEDELQAKQQAMQQNIESSLFNDEDMARIASVSGIRKISPYVDVNAKSVRLSGNEDKFQPNMRAQNNEKEIEISAGKLGANFQISKGKVVVPKDFVSSFGVQNGEELIGKKVIFEFDNYDTVKTFEREFEIQAVDNGKTDSTFMYNYEFVLSSEDAQDIAKARSSEKPRYYQVTVNSDGSKSINDLKKDLESVSQGRWTVSSFADERKTVNDAINVAAAGLGAFGGLAVLASVFGIINTQYISVLERTRQIGLMKSLGMKNAEIAKLFRYEAALIGMFGGLLGVAIAQMFTLLNPVISGMLRTNGVELLQMDYVASAILVLALMIVAVLSGYFPARKAARLNPIEALRTE